MIKYRTCSYSYGRKQIEAIEVDKESSLSVWIGGNRQAKASNYHHFHDSWQEAKAYLLDKAERQLDHARSQLQRAQDELGNIKGLKEQIQ